MNGDPSPESLINLSGQVVRDGFEKVENGIKGAIDFLRKQVSVQYLKNLPYPALLLPLSVFFAEPTGKSVTYSHETLTKIKQWFWRSCFSERYSSQTRKTTKADIAEMKKLKEGAANTLGDFTVAIRPEFFATNQFRLASSVTQTFILMLAEKKPRSFLSGSQVDLEKVLQQYNRSEFHHIFPRAYLSGLSKPDSKINALANFCFINSAENKQIGKKKPSAYKEKMPRGRKALQEVVDHAFCDLEMFDDNFEAFLKRRTLVLFNEAKQLMGI